MSSGAHGAQHHAQCTRDPAPLWALDSSTPWCTFKYTKPGVVYSGVLSSTPEGTDSCRPNVIIMKVFGIINRI